jgi:hypothetical protein
LAGFEEIMSRMSSRQQLKVQDMWELPLMSKNALHLIMPDSLPTLPNTFLGK